MGVFRNTSVSPAAKGKILTGNEQERAELGRKAGLTVGRDDSASLKMFSLQYKFGNALVSPEVMEKWADGARSHHHWTEKKHLLVWTSLICCAYNVNY